MSQFLTDLFAGGFFVFIVIAIVLLILVVVLWLLIYFFGALFAVFAPLAEELKKGRPFHAALYVLFLISICLALAYCGKTIRENSTEDTPKTPAPPPLSAPSNNLTPM